MTKSRWVYILLALVLLPVGWVSWWGLGRLEVLSREDTGQSLAAVLGVANEGLVIWARGTKATVAAIAEREEIVRAVEAQLGAGRGKAALLRTAALADLKRLLHPEVLRHGFTGWVVVAPDGEQVAAMLDEAVGDEEARQEDLATVDAALSGGVALGLPFRARVPVLTAGGKRVAGVPTMIAASAVRNQAGKVIAALAIRLDPAQTFTFVTQLGRMGETGETYAFDRSGRLVTETRFDSHLRQIGLIPAGKRGILEIEIRDPGVNMVEGHQAALPRDRQPLTLMARSAILGERGLNVEGYRDYRGVPVLGAWLWNSELDVGLTTEIDLAEALNPVHTTRRLVLFMLGALVIGAAMMGGTLARRTVLLARSVARERQAVRARDDLLAVVSHDLRNPLNSIRLSAGWLARRIETHASVERCLTGVQRIRSSTDAMLYLVEGLLAAAQIERGSLEVVSAKCPVGAALARAREIFAPLAQERRIALSTVAPDASISMLADPEAIFRVLSNLIGNALKFTPGGGEVSVSAYRAGDEVCFVVEDTGPGIPKEHLAHVFDRYWQAKSTGGLGVGLGLYIAKGIVEAHGGRIGIDSRVGHGTKVYFSVPAAD